MAWAAACGSSGVAFAVGSTRTAQDGTASQLRLHSSAVAKRLDKNDATMDISASQLVPPNRPVVPQQSGVSRNDASMWIGNVVNTADFAPAPPKRGGKRGKLVVGLVTAAAVAGGGGYAYYAMSSSSPSAAAPTSGAPVAASPAKPMAVVPLDAAESAAADAALATTKTAAIDADAVSAADPSVKKPTSRKKTTTKRVLKKKRHK